MAHRESAYKASMSMGFGSQSPHKMCHSHGGTPGIPGAERQTLGQAGRLAKLGSARDQGSLYKVENA